MKIQIEVTCANCVYRDHSGAFTPGGAKAICGHNEAPVSFYPGTPEQFKTAAAEYSKVVNSGDLTFEGQRKYGEEHSPYHWKFRIIDVNAEPPAQCPLRKFEVGRKVCNCDHATTGIHAVHCAFYATEENVQAIKAALAAQESK